MPSWVKKFVELAQFWQFLVKPSRNFELWEENQLSWPQNRLDIPNGLELKTEKITQQISDLLISQGIASHQSENCCTSKDWLCPWKSKPIGIITYKKCHLCSKIIWQGKCDQYLCVFVTRIHPCNKRIQNYKELQIYIRLIFIKNVKEKKFALIESFAFASKHLYCYTVIPLW